MGSLNRAAALISSLSNWGFTSSESTSQESSISLESLQADHLLKVLSLAGRKRAHRSSGCTPSVHILTCGHSLCYHEGHETPCTLACRKPCSSNESGSDLGRSQDCASITTPDENEEMSRISVGTDSSRRMNDLEEYPVCPDCWLRQCLIRWYYFVEESKLSVGAAAFDTMEIVPNFLSVYMYPEIVEVSRKIDGVIHTWSGPWVIASYYHQDAHMMGVIGGILINEEDEIPLARAPTRPSFATTVHGPGECIKEIKFVPLDKIGSVNKKVAFKENIRVRYIPVDAYMRSLDEIAIQRNMLNAARAEAKRESNRR